MNVEKYQERLWAEIDLDALVHNYKQIQKLVNPQTKMLSVVKANAYGHGAVQCARALCTAGAENLAVASLEEALELRRADINISILILGYVPSCEADTLIHYNLTATVYTTEFARALSVAAVRQNKQARIHIKVNTGMERIGFECEEVEQMLEVYHLPGLYTEGIFSHLACADCPDSSAVHTQYQRFMTAADKLKAAGAHIPFRHLLNSAGIFDFPEYQLDMVRPGIILYGYYPSAAVRERGITLRPVMSLKTRVIHLHQIAPGTGVSYGWTFTAKTPMLVATIPVGYADGYCRLLSNRAHMLSCGQRVPVIGKICMDQCMIDVTSVHTIHVGSEITIMGKGGEAAVTAEELAQLSETISYEILCAIGKRVPRLYYENGEAVGVLNGFS